jgi:hypothetical protein
MINSNGDIISSFPIRDINVYIDGASLRSDITLTHIDSGITVKLLNDNYRDDMELTNKAVLTTLPNRYTATCVDATMRRVTLHSRGVPISSVDVIFDGSSGQLGVDGSNPYVFPYSTLNGYCFGMARTYFEQVDVSSSVVDRNGRISGASFTGHYLADTDILTPFYGINANGHWRLNINNRAQMGSNTTQYTPILLQWGLTFKGSMR